MAEFETGVIIGADTHKQSHTIAIISSTGQEIAAKQFIVDVKGYKHALEWALSFGVVLRAGIESTGSYGAGLCSYFKESGVEVYDVYAPDKKRRRLQGKDDIKDAFQAAQAALSLTRCSQAKDKDEAVEAALFLENAYKLAVRQRTACTNALQAVVVRLPGSMREKLKGKDVADLVKTCAAYRVQDTDADLASGTKHALRHYARQVQSLDKEIKALDEKIKRYAQMLVPNTMDVYGAGHHVSITLLGAAGANIDRLKNDSAFSMLCGVSPVPVASGNNHRHRLNRGGNRRANSALHTIAVVRLGRCERTKEFIEKKMSEGKSKKDGIRALKRYLAREIYGSLKADLAMLGLIA